MRDETKEISVINDASDVGLATILTDLIRQNLEQDPRKREVVHTLNERILLEVLDLPARVVLEFRRGKIVITLNFIPSPDLHIATDSATLLDLCQIKFRLGLPILLDVNGRKVMKKLLNGKLIVRDLWSHRGTVIKLMKLFSVAKESQRGKRAGHPTVFMRNNGF